MKGKSILLCSRERSYTKFAIFSYAISMLLLFGSISVVWAKAPTTGKIVFTSTRDGNSEIYIMNPDGSDQINLSRDNADDSDPVWSPDGEQILFVSDRDGPPDLYVMDSDGSGVRRVFGSREYRSNPSWSPDGRKVTYVEGDERHATIYTATIRGRFVNRVTDGFMPSWSPDGREIVFSAVSVNRSPLGVFSLKNRSKKMLLSNKMPWIIYPVWSPRGNKIAFSQIDGEFIQGILSWAKANIYIVNRDGTGLHQIAKDEALVAMEPTWSPHGDELIYTDVIMQPDEAFSQLFRTDMTDNSPVQLTHDGDNFGADWFDPTALPVQPQSHLLTTVWGKIKTN